ncbi:hypothetical protein GPL15_20110 [Clostridium sp. MCC353]|uniref:hypothetical protein n=1 Tax=Clostridium sp. MCC353 TaxID=2592646 RepID=UPI001C01DC15|nr:hypothetical protein [Clostridium sp. MCC353]MBT9778788.1 hypothetical protein [Clostridium sp. MCC353]
MRKKQIIPIALAVSMAAGLLGGCSLGSNTDADTDISADTDLSANTSKAAEAGETSPQGEITAKGRYAESNIAVPGGAGDMVADIIQLDDGTLELYMNNESEYSRYQLRDGKWEKQETSFLEEVKFPYGFNMIYGQDGIRYVAYNDMEDYRSHLLKLEEGQPPKELLEDILSVKKESGYYAVHPDYYGIMADGTILMSDKDKTTAYTQDGVEIFSMPQQWSSMDWRQGGFLYGDVYMTIGDNGFLEYSVKEQSGMAKANYPFQSKSEYGDHFSAMASDRKNGFYVLNAEGIHHMNLGGSIWETVVDGKLNSLSMPSASLNKLFVGTEDDFYVLLGTADSDEIKHYVFDPEMPAVPSKTLTVYGLDLSENDTIRQAASMFQLNNPDVIVELIDGSEASGSTTVSDTIRTLNTEILGGNGADILILDGLPVDSYIEKGVLDDMKDLLKPMIDSGELLDNVTRPFMEEDGSLYQIPARMILLASYGDQKAIDSLGSLETIRAYQQNPANKPLRPKTNYENLLRQMISLTYDEIVDQDSKQLVPGKIKELLETVQIVGEACGAKAIFDEDEDSGKGRVYNMIFGKGGFSIGEYDRVDTGKSSIAIENIKGLSDMMLPFAVIKKNHFTLQPVNRSYMPVGILGINKGSKNLELARQFVQYVVGSEVQGSDLTDGLPVNTKGIEEWMIDKKTSMYSIGVSGGDGYELSGEWPNYEEKKQIFRLAEDADHPIVVDRVLLGIIIDETKGLFDGTLSLEQAAQNAENKAKLYFSE